MKIARLGEAWHGLGRVLHFASTLRLKMKYAQVILAPPRKSKDHTIQQINQKKMYIPLLGEAPRDHRVGPWRLVRYLPKVLGTP